MGKKITVYGLAKEAGVSTATISRVINNNPHVDYNTRKTILELFKLHDYRPKMAMDRSMTIAVLIDKVEDPGSALSEYVSGIFQGALNCANQNNIVLTILLHDFEKLRHPEDLIAHLLARGIHGAIFVNPKVDVNFIYSLREIEYPFITIGSFFSDFSIKSLNIDNREGIRQAIKHLKETGHRHIGYIGVDNRQYDTIERYDAFVTYMEDDFNSEFVYISNRQDGDHKKTIFNYLENKFQKGAMKFPTAYVCLNDDVAVGAMRAISNHGIKIPDDISIIGFDDYAYSRYIFPSLTTIKNPLIEIGRLACQNLIHVFEGNDKVLRKLFLPELVVRESSKEL
jgi:LacI family transcriptional regulator